MTATLLLALMIVVQAPARAPGAGQLALAGRPLAQAHHIESYNPYRLFGLGTGRSTWTSST